MSYSMEEWTEIARFPICPVKALEEVLVDKEISQKDLINVNKLIENLKNPDHITLIVFALHHLFSH